MTILQQPDALSLSGNIKDFRISTSDKISLILRQGDDEILAQSYEPSSDGIVTVSLKDIISSRLFFQLQETALVYQQKGIIQTFTAIVADAEVSFQVIRAGVDCLADTATNFLTQNFLTWQPTVKPVTYYSPEFLTYYAVVGCVAKLHAYFTDNAGVVISQQDLTLANLDAGKAYTIPLQYASVAEKLGNKTPAYYDVWMEDQDGNRLTYIQRYYASAMFSEQEQWILFENSLGGIDTFRAYGTCDFTGEHTHNIVEVDEVAAEYRVDTERKFQKNTGFLNDRERRWLLDFFPALVKYIYTGSYIRPIVVVESNVTYTDHDLPSNYTFTYKYADARPLLNLTRTDVTSGDLNITVPDAGSFTVPPRLVEFPRLPLTEGALFPIQNPYAEKWSTTTAGSLSDYIAERLSQNYGGGGGVGHQHNNIDLLQLLSFAEEYLLVAAKKIKSGYSDEAYTLSENTAHEIITFLKGLTADGPIIANDGITANSLIEASKGITADGLVTANDGIIANSLITANKEIVANDLITANEGITADGSITANNSIVANDLITVNGSIQFGSSFATGINGHGGRITAAAHGELESLVLRRFLEVPELRYNRVDVSTGDKWSSPGGGLIQSVDGDVITLKLELGEIGAVAVDDLCIGIYHFESGNATNNYDDSKGNRQFAGFTTVYFRIVEILKNGLNNKFRFELRGASDNYPDPVLPQAMMTFVCYGNVSNKERQSSMYQTRTYTRYLKNVDWWEYSFSNIAMQFGDLSNLSAFGADMAGYSCYIDSLYFTGKIEQLEKVVENTLGTGDLRMEFKSSNGEVIVNGYIDTVISARVLRYFKNLTSDVIKWLWTRESGNEQVDKASDADWNDRHAHINSNEIHITSIDIPETAKTVKLICEATIGNTNIKDIVTF